VIFEKIQVVFSGRKQLFKIVFTLKQRNNVKLAAKYRVVVKIKVLTFANFKI